MPHGYDSDAPNQAAAPDLWVVSLTELRSRFADMGRRQRKIVCVLTHSIIPAWPPLEELPKPKKIATLTYSGCRAATLRDARQVFDRRREGDQLVVEPRIADKPVYDLTGKPILFSDGQPISIELGATRQCEIYADGSTPERLAICEEFLSAAAQAGRCLHGLPNEVQRVVWRDWPDGSGKVDDGFFWINTVFELAWKRLPGSPLAADRWVWKGQQRASLDSLQHLRTMAKVHQAYRWLAEIPNPPAHWYSILEDLPSASTAALDILLTIEIASSEQSPNRDNDPQDNKAGTSGKTNPKRRGRQRDTDAKADKRVAEAWSTGRYKTYDELAAQLNMKRSEVKRAIDRHRKRHPRR